MKYLAMLLGMLVMPVALAGDLKLEIHGTGLMGKTIYVAVHSAVHAQDFPGQEQNARTEKVVATADVFEVTMPDFPRGEYAVAVFADSNGNQKLDSNFLGIPKEPVGVSRDTKGRFGPPKFADAAFKMGDGVTALTIKLK